MHKRDSENEVTWYVPHVHVRTVRRVYVTYTQRGVHVGGVVSGRSVSHHYCRRLTAMSTSSALLKGSGSANFSGMWPRMQPVVLKLLKQERVSRDEWQDLFW